MSKDIVALSLIFHFVGKDAEEIGNIHVTNVTELLTDYAKKNNLLASGGCRGLTKKENEMFG